MLTDAAAAGDLAFHIQNQVREAAEYAPASQEGWIIGSSYSPGEAVAEPLFGSTYPILGDDGDSYINYTSLPLITTQPGDLYGPTGLEHVVVIPTESGYAILYKHSPYDTPLVPPGERWILHKNTATQAPESEIPAVWDGGAQFTNDGTNQGDGLGGSHFGYMGDYTAVKTAQSYLTTYSDTDTAIVTTTPGTAGQTGLTSVWSDVTQTIMHGVLPVGGGQPILMTVVDGLGAFSGAANSISHVVPEGGLIGLGTGLVGSLPSTYSAMNQDIMNGPYADLVNEFQLMNLINYYGALNTALTAGGLPNPSAFLASMVEQIVAGFISKIGAVTGSQYVRLQT